MAMRWSDMKYSIVMAVYKGDRSEWLKQALDSLLGQTIASDDIIIIADGPLTPELNATLSQYKSEKSISLKRLPKNQGLGNALNIGISLAKHELVGRMDADDIAVSNRFELQLAKFIDNLELDILGGQIAEFVEDPESIVAYRRVPTAHDDIKYFARRRSPFNHPTVMYKKSTIQRLGGYDMAAIRIEDYDLWLRAIAQGAQCANLDHVLLNYRATPEAMKRRKTFASWKNHIRTRFQFYRKQYITLSDFFYGVFTQTALLVIPGGVARGIFNRTVRK